MSNFNVGSATDYIMHKAGVAPINAPRMVASASPRIVACEYCGRGAYLSEGLTCKGCGGPLPFNDAMPAMFISHEILDADALRCLGTPGMNIPIRGVPEQSRLSDFICHVGSAAAGMFGNGL